METFFTTKELELHQLVSRYQEIENQNSPASNLEKNKIIQQLSWIPRRHSSKYRKFSNGEDLVQEANVSLVLALKTWTPKAPFLWWADSYIKIKLARAASAHASLRSSLKNIKTFRPMKVGNVEEHHEARADLPKIDQLKNLQEKDWWGFILNKLPQEEKDSIIFHYGFFGEKDESVPKVAEKMGKTIKEVEIS